MADFTREEIMEKIAAGKTLKDADLHEVFMWNASPSKTESASPTILLCLTRWIHLSSWTRPQEPTPVSASWASPMEHQIPTLAVPPRFSYAGRREPSASMH